MDAGYRWPGQDKTESVSRAWLRAMLMKGACTRPVPLLELAPRCVALPARGRLLAPSDPIEIAVVFRFQFLACIVSSY